jgi:hypothetical protein
MSHYNRAFENGKPTVAFKRASALYRMTVDPDGSVKYKPKDTGEITEEALKVFDTYKYSFYKKKTTKP